MKVIDLESTSQSLKVEVQRYTPSSWDIQNVFDQAVFLMLFSILFFVMWRQSDSTQEFIIWLLIIFTGIISALPLLFFRYVIVLGSRLEEVVGYIFDRGENLLYQEWEGIWGYHELRKVTSLTDIKEVTIDVSVKSFASRHETFYKVKVKHDTDKEETLEENYISVFSSANGQHEFQEMINQAKTAVNQIHDFLNLSSDNADY